MAQTHLFPKLPGRPDLDAGGAGGLRCREFARPASGRCSGLTRLQERASAGQLRRAGVQRPGPTSSSQIWGHFSYRGERGVRRQRGPGRAGRAFPNTRPCPLSACRAGTCTAVRLSRPDALRRRGRAYLRPRWGCGRGSPGASRTSGLSTAGPRGGQAPASLASLCPPRPSPFPRTPRPVSRVTSSNRALGPPLVLRAALRMCRVSSPLSGGSRPAPCCALGWPRAGGEAVHPMEAHLKLGVQPEGSSSSSSARRPREEEVLGLPRTGHNNPFPPTSVCTTPPLGERWLIIGVIIYQILAVSVLYSLLNNHVRKGLFFPYRFKNLRL